MLRAGPDGRVETVSLTRQGGGKGPRYGKHVDANQLEIVKALEAIGCDVAEIGWPVDLLVGYRAMNFLIEIKDPAKPPSERKLTSGQRDFFRMWRGQVRKVESVDDAIKLVTRSYLRTGNSPFPHQSGGAER